MATFLKSTTDAVGGGLKQGGEGLGNAVTSAGNLVNPNAQKSESKPPQSGETPSVPKANEAAPSGNPVPSAPSVPSVPTDVAPSVPTPEAPETSSGGFGSGLTKGIGSLGSTLGSGASTITNPAVQASKAGGGFIKDVTSAGASIGQSVAKTGANVTVGVAGGTADLAGTAIGGIVETAANTSGKIFQPIASGLKAIEGLEALGGGLEKVNGLPIGAVQQVSTWTTKAMNMSGVTPTYFDPNGDGVVNMEDTIKGLIVLGLPDQYAKYAAYALHTVFSYSTSESWIPSTDTNFPIHINKMNNTRWGKNWGTYERMDWCQDIDVETFFQTSESDSSFEQWKETFKKGRQYFGVLLLIFEWGTTWPFWMPPVPAQEIPFKDDIGKVVRTVILPTIFSNFQKAREADPTSKTEPPPGDAPPTDAKGA